MYFSALKKNTEPELADWPAPSPAITGIDLQIEKGELVLISGPVAGGKSTLLQSLVGNTEQLAGELKVPEQSAFQPQSPILFDQTIRANILFGVAEEDANEAWVQQSLEASTLSLDMVRSIFPPLTNTHTHKRCTNLVNLRCIATMQF